MDEIVVVCTAPEDDPLVYSGFGTYESAQMFIDNGPCENDHFIANLIDVRQKQPDADELDDLVGHGSFGE